MDDTRIGLLMVLCAILVASGISGFRRAQGDGRTRGAHWYVALTFLWFTGTLAAYPSFVMKHGNKYLVFAFLMTVLSALLAMIATWAFWWICSLASRAWRKYDAYQAVH